MGRMLVTFCAFFFQTVGLSLSFYALFDPHWKRSDPTARVIDKSYNSVGLWKMCTHSGDNKNTYNCEGYNKIVIELPTPLIASRVLVILSLIFGSLAIATGIVSNDCILCWKKPRNRVIMRYLATLFCFLAAGSILIAITWYAKLVMRQLTSDETARMVFGKCLYFGLFSSISQTMAGVCFLFTRSTIWENHRHFQRLNKSGDYPAPPASQFPPQFENNNAPNSPIMVPDLKSGRENSKNQGHNYSRVRDSSSLMGSEGNARIQYI